MKCFHRKYQNVGIAIWVAVLVALSAGTFCSSVSWATRPSAKAQADSDELEMELDEPTPAAPTPHPSLRSVEVLRGLIAKNDKDVNARIELAEVYEKQKNYTGMIDTLRPNIEKLNRNGFLLLARGYSGKADYLNEVRSLELLLAQNDKDYYVQNLAGEAYVRLGKSDDAIEHFNNARELNRRYKEAYANLIKQYQKTGNNSEALNLLTDMLKIFGRRPDVLTQLCKMYSDQGFHDRAFEICPEAIAASPQNPENHLYYAQTLADDEQKEKSAKVLREAAIKFPKSELTQWTAGNLAFEQKNYVASYNYFSQCTLADSKSSRCFLGLAKSAFELQKNPEALAAYDKACQLNPGMVGEIRKAASQLRQKKDLLWPIRYDAVTDKCSGLSGRQAP